MSKIKIRTVNTDDTDRMLEIYSYYVKYTAISFEYDVPSAEEFKSRIERTLKKYPYLAAEKDGVILGYAYAGAFIGRAAYDRSAEVTIYLDRFAKGQGLGKALYERLEPELKKMGITNLYACIGVPTNKEDEYLTFNSQHFHEHIGYHTAGRFYKCGYKFDRWYDMVWLEKIISEHTSPAANVRGNIPTRP